MAVQEQESPVRAMLLAAMTPSRDHAITLKAGIVMPSDALKFKLTTALIGI